MFVCAHMYECVCVYVSEFVRVHLCGCVCIHVYE